MLQPGWHRDRRRFPAANFGRNEARLRIVEADFLDAATLRALPQSIDAACYLILVVRNGGIPACPRSSPG